MRYIQNDWVILTKKIPRSMLNPLYWIPFIKPYREVIISKIRVNDYSLKIPKKYKKVKK